MVESSAATSAAQHELTYNPQNTRITTPSDRLFNRNDSRIKEDIIRMILQYLHEEGLQVSRLTLHDEANVRWRESEELHLELRRIRKAILDGDWTEVDKMSSKSFIRNQKSFLYAIYKQQYLEMIENRELQKAFAFLNKRLKPLETLQSTPSEFKDLCYLLTAQNIQDAPSFRGWDGIVSSRQNLVDQFQSMLQLEALTEDASTHVPTSRLVQLLQQAVAYQIESSRYHPSLSPKVNTLLHDYQTLVIPNTVKSVMSGHRSNVKCVEWVGELGLQIVSGSSDCTLRLWDSQQNDGVCLDTALAHSSRVWDCSSTKSGSHIASVGGDGTLKVWDMKNSKFNLVSSFNASKGDLYCVEYHQGDGHLVTGGYDKIVRLYDVAKSTVVSAFAGHSLSVSSCIFNPYGNLIISGYQLSASLAYLQVRSKDNTIRFWDINSGICIKSLGNHLGEVSSVDINANGSMLLTSSKDNSIRLWDIRMIRPVRRYKGHQNTCKNFIRASFASSSLIVSGSEDGRVHVWDIEQQDPIQRLEGHEGAIYAVKWNAKQSKWASCSDDRTVRSWWFDVDSKK